MRLVVAFGRDKIPIELAADATVEELAATIDATLDVPAEKQKLLVKGRKLTHGALAEAGVADGDAVTLMGTTRKVLEEVAVTAATAAAHAAIDVRDDLSGAVVRKRVPGLSSGRKVLEQYRFDSFKALPGLPMQEQAEAFLRRVANDRAVKAVMHKYKWRVPLLSEMYPKGRVGEETCIMGLNINKGQEIQLRLRTDDLRSFRPYNSVLNVLWHELSHNVYSEHDTTFYNFMSEIKHTGESLDWARSSTGHSLGGADIHDDAAAPPPHVEYQEAKAFEGGTFVLSNEDDTALDVRELAALAAIERANKAAADAAAQAAPTAASAVAPSATALAQAQPLPPPNATASDAIMSSAQPVPAPPLLTPPTTDPASLKTVQGRLEDATAQVCNVVAQVNERNGDPHKTLRVLRLVIHNVLAHEGDPKYQTIRTANPAFQAATHSVPAVSSLLACAGFVLSADGSVYELHRPVDLTSLLLTQDALDGMLASWT